MRSADCREVIESGLGEYPSLPPAHPTPPSPSLAKTNYISVNTVAVQ